MKKLIFSIICILLITVANVSAEDGPVIHYSFDGSSVQQVGGEYVIQDISGNEFDAISIKTNEFYEHYILDNTTGYGKAFYGALKLNNSYLKTIDSEYTISFIGVNYASMRPVPIIKLGPVLFTSAWGSGWTRIGSYYEDNIERIAFNIFTAVDDYNMYTFVYNNGTLEMYLNGDKITDRFDRGDLQYAITEIVQDDEVEFIVQNEYLDEFRLYNRALTDEEIQELYENTKHLILIPTPTLTPDVTPTPGQSPTLTVDGEVVSAENVDGDYTIIAAQYDAQGNVIKISVSENEALELVKEAEAAKVVAFLWDGMDTMKPITDKKEI